MFWINKYGDEIQLYGKSFLFHLRRMNHVQFLGFNGITRMWFLRLQLPTGFWLSAGGSPLILFCLMRERAVTIHLKLFSYFFSAEYTYVPPALCWESVVKETQRTARELLTLFFLFFCNSKKKVLEAIMASAYCRVICYNLSLFSTSGFIFVYYFFSSFLRFLCR